MDRYDTVVFDVGNVLVRWDPLRVVGLLFPELDEAGGARLAALCGGPAWKALDAGCRVEDLGQHLSAAELPMLPQLQVLARDFWQHMPRIEAGFSLVRRLREQHGARLRLLVLSNFPKDAFARVRDQHPEFLLFDGMTVSGFVGLTKPDRAIFARLVEDHGVRAPERALFIDDSEANVAASRAFGIEALLCDDHDRVTADLKRLGLLQ